MSAAYLINVSAPEERIAPSRSSAQIPSKFADFSISNDVYELVEICFFAVFACVFNILLLLPNINCIFNIFVTTACVFT